MKQDNQKKRLRFAVVNNEVKRKCVMFVGWMVLAGGLIPI